MAVTLQLARITPAELAECRRSAAALHRLCPFYWGAICRCLGGVCVGSEG